MMKILLMTSNNINNNPRPNRLLNFLLDNNYSLDLLNYNKSEREVKQYYFKKKMNIDQSINWLRTNSNIYRVGKKHKREFHV